MIRGARVTKSASLARRSILGSALCIFSLVSGCHAPARTDLTEPTSVPSVPMALASVQAPSSPALEPLPAVPADQPESATPPAAPSAPPKNTPRRRYVVAALGDSLTDFRSNGGGYLKELQARCPESRFDSYGKGGDMVNQMRRRAGKELFDAPAVAGSYTHLIVFGGVNDLYSDLTAGRTVAKISADLTAIYGTAHAHGMKVVALTVSPWGGFSRYFTEARAKTTLELNRFIVAQRAAKTADFVVDTYPLLSCGDPEKLCDADAAPFHDGLHFGPGGHRKIADALHEAVFSDCR